MEDTMDIPETHDIIGIFYTQDEAAQILGVTRSTYTKALSNRPLAYHRYMRTLSAQLIKDINSHVADHPRNTQHLPTLARAIVEAGRRSAELDLVPRTPKKRRGLRKNAGDQPQDLHPDGHS
jgi:hypothetical protein